MKHKLNTYDQYEVEEISKFIQSLNQEDKKTFLSQLSPDHLEALKYCWDIWARPKQRIPDFHMSTDIKGNPFKLGIDPLTGEQMKWDIWALVCGRGFGKTRVGSEAIRKLVCGETPLTAGQYSRVGLIGANEGDVRDAMIMEGILPAHPKDFRPRYIKNEMKLEWPNGATALIRYDTEPERLRGNNFDLVWCDELAKYKNMKETWDQINFATRINDHPIKIITTTPRMEADKASLLMKIISREKTYVTKGSSLENAANLGNAYLEALQENFAGNRMGRQEIDGEIIQEVSGSLWRSSMIKPGKVPDRKEVPMRIVMGVDPSGSIRGDECGIVIACKTLTTDPEYYVLYDGSFKAGPAEWAEKIVKLYHNYGVDRIVVERNFGGDMASEIIKSVDPEISIKETHSSRGKMIRAEPVAALYEKGMVYHDSKIDLDGHSNLIMLEEEMTSFTGKTGEKSPNRLDALVFAIQELKGKNKDINLISKVNDLQLKGFWY